jgi:single-strand DNA-binding protein
MGHLTKDAETKWTSGGTALAKMSIAVNRWKKDAKKDEAETDFFDIEAWGKTAEAAEVKARKGALVLVVGELRQDRWDDKASGQKRSKIKVVARSIKWFPSAKGNNGGSKSGLQGAHHQVIDADDFGAEDMPF